LALTCCAELYAAAEVLPLAIMNIADATATAIQVSTINDFNGKDHTSGHA